MAAGQIAGRGMSNFQVNDLEPPHCTGAKERTPGESLCYRPLLDVSILEELNYVIPAKYSCKLECGFAVVGFQRGIGSLLNLDPDAGEVSGKRFRVKQRPAAIVALMDV
ncbi:MAG: hypothetical protein QGH94_18475, partial [Phycisphaerae bacterium]|nr:hypothetical protein [Phycisphaerae bacterium]